MEREIDNDHTYDKKERILGWNNDNSNEYAKNLKHEKDEKQQNGDIRIDTFKWIIYKEREKKKGRKRENGWNWYWK